MAKQLILPKEFERIDKQFQFLSSIPEIEQKSKEWFEQRHNLITASSCASALSENKYKTRLSFLIDKCLPSPPFESSIATHHGNKYEDVATMIYESLYNINVKLFGLIPHPTISFIGASPDGICNSTTKSDGSFSPKYGTMLEIKCPFKRKITKTGIIDGDIVPHYYYIQVQVQLEVCDLDICDFWQCTIREYETKEEWLNSKPEPILENTNLLKGAIIQLLPIGKNSIFDAKYIYPPTMNMNCEEYQMWIEENILKIPENLIFDKVIYWRLDDCFNQEIKRDRKWFKSALPRFKEFWDEVLYYRSDPIKLKELQRKTYSFDNSF